MPTQDKLQALAEWLQIDPHWLRFGEERFGWSASVGAQTKDRLVQLMGTTKS